MMHSGTRTPPSPATDHINAPSVAPLQIRSPVLLLASASPRRSEILSQLGLAHEVVRIPAAPGEDEPVLPGEAPGDYVRRTAREKAIRAAKWLDKESKSDHWPYAGRTPVILCADTTVCLEGRILGKPQDPDHASRMLNDLSDRVHHVHTAVVLWALERLWEAHQISTVTFKRLTPEEIQRYCATGDPLDKAGGYGIQGPAAAFVSHLSGSYTGVMGLPAYDTMELLTAAGVTAASLR